MKYYKIPVTRETWEMLKVPANSLEEAEELVKSGSFPQFDGYLCSVTVKLDKEDYEYGKIISKIDSVGQIHLHTGKKILENERHEGKFYYEVMHDSYDKLTPKIIEDVVDKNFYGTIVFDEEIPDEMFTYEETGGRYADFDDVMLAFEISARL